MSSKIFSEARKNISDESRQFVQNSFGLIEQIHSILQRKKITQRQLAKLLNKSESEISKILSPGHNLTLRTLSKFEVALEEKIIYTKPQIVNKPSARVINIKKHVNCRKKKLIASERSSWNYKTSMN